MILRDVYEQLWQAAHHANLMPPIPLYQSVFAHYMQRGDEELMGLRKELGRWRWWRGMGTVSNPTLGNDNRRVLGMGIAFSEYLLTPLPIAHDDLKRVVQLGAMANFIVSFYDYLLDHHLASQDVLSEQSLKLALHGNAQAKPKNPTERVLLALVNHYIKGIKQLPYTTDHSQILHLLLSAIQRMYSAQVLLHNGIQKTSLLVRKSSYPFLVMGLAGWLAVPPDQFDQKLLCWHLRWMLRTGWFYGQIDDLADMHIDFMAGEPNVFLDKQWQSLDESGTSIEQVMHLGQRVHTEWEQRTQLPPTPTMTQHVFHVGLAGWLSALPLD